MKRLLKYLLVAVLVAPTAISCESEPKSDPEGEKPSDDVIVALAKTSEGVTIRATEISDKDFVLSLEMGLECPSYRFDVLPLMRFKNDFMEAQKTKPNMSEEEYIIQKLFNNTGTGGYSMDEPVDSSWEESVFKMGKIVHNVDYIVLTCGCLDADANKPAEVNSVIVPLKSKEVIGDPSVDIKLVINHIGFEAHYAMNDDCYGYYTLETPTDAVDEAFNLYGAKGLRDLICCFALEPDTENAFATKSWGYDAVPGTKVTAIAVGMDIEGTLSTSYSREDGEITEAPVLPAAKYELTITNTSALTYSLLYDTDYSVTSATFCRWYAPDQWAAAKAQYTERQIQIQLALEGWGQNEPMSPNQLMFSDINPNTEYILVSTGRNKAMELTPLKEIPFKTKSLVFNTPELSLAKVSAKPLMISRDQMQIEYSFPEGTTLYFERILEKGSKEEGSGLDLTDPANKDALIQYLISDGNVAAYTEDEPYTYADLVPNQPYFYFIVAEDKNGIMGPLYSFEFSTETNTGGANPKIELVQKLVGDGNGYRWSVEFKLNEDVSTYRYCIDEDRTDISDPMPSRINTWTDIVIGDNGMSAVSSSSLDVTVSAYSRSIALAVPYGANNKQGELAYLLFDPALITSSMLPVKPLQMSVRAK